MIGRPVAAIGEEASGLETQLADFFGLHYDRLTRLAGLVCHTGIAAEDAVQAAMEQAWRRRDSLRDPERLRSWLDRIVVREAIRLNRGSWWSRLRRGEAGEAGTAGAAGTSGASVDRTGGVDPTWIALAESFRGLPVEQRGAVALHLYAGHTVEETAELMGASVETTRSRLRLARQRLRRELGEDDR